MAGVCEEVIERLTLEVRHADGARDALVDGGFERFPGFAVRDLGRFDGLACAMLSGRECEGAVCVRTVC